jgi:hypothetical protein
MTTFDLAKMLLTGLVGLAGFLYYLSHIFEHGASKTAIEQFRAIVERGTIVPALRAAFKFFALSADQFFGPKLLSFRSVTMSTLLSTFWIGVVLATCLAVFPNYSSWLSSKASLNLIARSAALLFVTTIVADFISVCATRFIVRVVLGKGRSWLLPALIVDLVVSAGIFYVLFSSAKFLLFPSLPFPGIFTSFETWLNPAGLPIQMQFLQDLTSDMLVPDGSGAFKISGNLLAEVVYAFPESVTFFSSLLTSLWLWLYVVTYLLLVAAVRLERRWSAAKRLLNLEHSPMYSLSLAVLTTYISLSALVLAIHAVIRAWSSAA